MAVLIASSLRKEFSGDPLFDGVSFKVERRDRVALAGPDGAGKTTLLGALVSETEPQGGELAFQKEPGSPSTTSARPLERRLTLRLASLRAQLTWSRWRELGGSSRSWRPGITARRHDPALRGERRPGSSTPAATTGAKRATAVARGLGFADEHLDRQLETLLGGAHRARHWRARSAGIRICSCSTSRRTISTSKAWSGSSASSRRSTPGSSIVAHDRWFLEAVTNVVLELDAGRSTYFRGPWHAWRLEKASRLHAASKAADRVGRDIERLERIRRALSRLQPEDGTQGVRSSSPRSNGSRRSVRSRSARSICSRGGRGTRLSS